MPEMIIEIPVKQVAKTIKSMSREELETLSLLLSEEGDELLERKKELELKSVELLSRDEVFDV